MPIIGAANGMVVHYPHKISHAEDSAAPTSAISSTLKYATILRLGESAAISKVGVVISGTPSASGTLRVRLETVAAQFPTGSLVAAGAEGTLASVATAGMKEVTIGTPPTIAPGTDFAIVMDSSDTLQANVARTSVGSAGFPYGAAWNGATWASVLTVSPRHTLYDGSRYIYVPQFIPSVSGGSTALTSASSPREVGGKFTLPFTAYIIGMDISLSGIAAGDTVETRLYAADGTTVLSGPYTHGGGAFSTTLIGYFPVTAIPRVSSGSVVYAAGTCTAGSVDFRNYEVITVGMFRTMLSEDGSVAEPTWVQRNAAGSGAWTETTTRKAEMHLLLVRA